MKPTEFQRQFHVHLGIAQHGIDKVAKRSGEGGCLCVHHALGQIFPPRGIARAGGCEALPGEVEQSLLEQRHAFADPPIALGTAPVGGFVIHRASDLHPGFYLAHRTAFQPLTDRRRTLPPPAVLRA